MSHSRRVAYYYDSDVGNYYYGQARRRGSSRFRRFSGVPRPDAPLARQGHPMKPHRMRMTHDLLTKYDVLNQMEARAAKGGITQGAFPAGVRPCCPRRQPRAQPARVAHLGSSTPRGHARTRACRRQRTQRGDHSVLEDQGDEAQPAALRPLRHAPTAGPCVCDAAAGARHAACRPHWPQRSAARPKPCAVCARSRRCSGRSR
jgi:hypothetical protein